MKCMCTVDFFDNPTCRTFREGETYDLTEKEIEGLEKSLGKTGIENRFTGFDTKPLKEKHPNEPKTVKTLEGKDKKTRKPALSQAAQEE